MRRSLVDTRGPSPLRRLCRCVCLCVCFFFSFFIVKSAPGFCVAGTFTSKYGVRVTACPPTHTHTHLMLQWRFLFCRNARRRCVFCACVCVCELAGNEAKHTGNPPPPPPHPPSLLPPSWPSPCEVGWAEIRRVTKTHSLGGWSERAGHVSLMFTGEIHDASGSKEKRTSACVCVCACVSGLFN